MIIMITLCLILSHARLLLILQSRHMVIPYMLMVVQPTKWTGYDTLVYYGKVSIVSLKPNTITDVWSFLLQLG